MEDLVESIVGDIYDEYDQQDEEVRKLKENIYVINGNSKLTEIQELLKVELVSKRL